MRNPIRVLSLALLTGAFVAAALIEPASPSGAAAAAAAEACRAAARGRA